MYVTRAQLKATLSLSGETFADADIDAALTAASRMVDGYCRRRFWADADANQVRLYTPSLPGRVAIDDLVTLTALEEDLDLDGVYETPWVLGTDFVLAPANAAADGLPYTQVVVHPAGNRRFGSFRYPNTIRLTGKFGWPAVPGEVVQATSILAGRLLKRAREAPLGVVVIGIESGAVGRVPSVDPDVRALLAPYVRLDATFA